jgi:hypothetical protein
MHDLAISRFREVIGLSSRQRTEHYQEGYIFNKLRFFKEATPLGAWIELGIEAALLKVIETAVCRYATGTGPPLRVLNHTREVLVRKNETLAFLHLFEAMTRPIHLDTYDDDGLGLLTEADHASRSML